MQVRALHDAPFCINNQQVMQSAIKLHPRYSKKYPTTIGIEDARILDGLNPSGSSKDCDILFNFHRDICRNNKNEEIKEEEGAIEISSDILTTPRQVIRFYENNNEFYNNFAQKYPKYPKLVPFSWKKEKYLEGGGGHLHLGLPKLEKESLDQFQLDVLVFLLNRPHIQWIMQEWCDDDTCVSTYYNALNHNLKFNQNGAHVKTWSAHLLSSVANNLFSGWGIGPIQFRTRIGDVYKEKYKSQAFNTIEFRLFSSFWDAQHIIDCIELACAIWEKCQKLIDNILYIRNTNDVIKFAKENDIIIEFNKDLEILGLDPKRYERYYINYHNRLKWGRLYSRTFVD